MPEIDIELYDGTHACGDIDSNIAEVQNARTPASGAAYQTLKARLDADAAAAAIVTTGKIAHGAVTPDKASFIAHKDGTNYISGWVDNTYINGDGVEKQATGLFSTTPVYLKPSTAYYWDKLYVGGYYAFYAADGTVLESHGMGSALTNPFTTPAGTVYGRFTTNEAARKTTAWISEQNQTPLPIEYEVSGVSVDNAISNGAISAAKIAESAVTPDKTSFVIQKPDSNCITGWVPNTYIRDGVETPYEGWYSTTAVYVKPGTAYYWANFYAGHYAFYRADGTIIESHSTNDPPSKPFVPPAGTAYARFTAVTDEQKNTSWVSTANAEPEPFAFVLSGIDTTYSDNPCDYDQPYISAFNTCICIGDSLTAGVFNHNDSGQDEYVTYASKSYPAKLQLLTGVQCTNEGLSSATFDEWYAQKASALTSGYDMAIIQLGVNDKFRYGEWTQTAATALNNIISDLQEANEGIKIFVATIIPAIAFQGEVYDEISQGIRDTVAALNDPNVILLDMAAHGHTADSEGYNVGHLSELGYTRLAMDYKNYISWVIARHMTDFRNIQFIGTDYYYDK